MRIPVLLDNEMKKKTSNVATIPLPPMEEVIGHLLEYRHSLLKTFEPDGRFFQKKGLPANLMQRIKREYTSDDGMMGLIDEIKCAQESAIMSMIINGDISKSEQTALIAILNSKHGWKESTTNVKVSGDKDNPIGVVVLPPRIKDGD